MYDRLDIMYLLLRGIVVLLPAILNQCHEAIQFNAVTACLI